MTRRLHPGPRVLAAVCLLLIALAAALLRPLGGGEPPRNAQQLRLAVLAAAGARDADAAHPRGPVRPGSRAVNSFPRGITVTVATGKTSNVPTFGQPTIAGVGGWGFEADLRLDPTSPSRVYMSSPDSGGSDTSWIWRSLDSGRTFKWVPAAAPLNGKVIPCPGGGDTELGVDTAGRLYFNDLSLANFSLARSDDFGQTFTPCNSTGVPDVGVDRQWYAIDGDPTAGGSVYLTNDEVGTGNVQCGPTTVNNVLVMYRSPAAAAPGSTAGVAFGPPNRITQAGSCDEGIMGNNEVDPVATRTGQVVSGGPTTLPTAVRHVFVIHDDGSLSKILIARCFPVAFGAPVTNVSDPSGLNCVDLPVANLGSPGVVRTGANFPSLAIDKAGNLYALWEQATMSGAKAGDTSLMYAYSTNEGNTWSSPIAVPTPGLANNVFGWIAAGDDGRVDIAWYGSAAHADLVNGGPNACPNGGPDSVPGSWSLYLTQTLNAHSAKISFTSPILAGEHPMRRGGIQTIMGNQCGGSTNVSLTGSNRTLGDFFQLRIGSTGEAQISYADSTNIDGDLYGSHAMYVSQNGGPGVFAKKSPSGPAIHLGSSTDAAGDATYEARGQTSANMPNLDILSSSLTWPAAASCHPAGTACLRVTMKVANLSTAAPVTPDIDTDEVWLTQWLLPASASCTSTAPSCVHGGLNFMVYAESNQGGAIQCWVGQSALEQNADGVQLTYPGTTQLTDPGACSAVTGANGTITIDVPLSQVSLDAGVAPFSTTLYSVTASTMTLPAQANSVPSLGGVGGLPFNVVDVAPAYDARP